MRPHLTRLQRRLDASEAPHEGRGRHPEPTPQRLEQVTTRTRRKLADIDYFLAAPLGWRDGAILVWAGMRGAVTVAAAETLPSDTPSRSLLVLIAFVVATASLLVQGGTLAPFVRWIRPTTQDEDEVEAERAQLRSILAGVRGDVIVTVPTDVTAPTGSPSDLPTRPDPEDREATAALLTLALRITVAQRDAVLDARDDGLFSSEVLEEALEHLDADQISIELRR